MIERFSLQDSYSARIQLTLTPGMGWAMYTDHGPSGICGQSMDITCPHAVFKTWPNEDMMRKDLESKQFRGGVRSNLIYGVVGEWGIGNGSVVIVKQEQKKDYNVD